MWRVRRLLDQTHLLQLTELTSQSLGLMGLRRLVEGRVSHCHPVIDAALRTRRAQASGLGERVGLCSHLVLIVSIYLIVIH